MQKKLLYLSVFLFLFISMGIIFLRMTKENKVLVAEKRAIKNETLGISPVKSKYSKKDVVYAGNINTGKKKHIGTEKYDRDEENKRYNDRDRDEENEELEELEREGESGEENENAFDELDKALAYEFNMIKNPTTGKVPEGVFEAEKEQARQISESQLGSRTTTANTYSFQGPDNLGGRTRTIAYDVRFNGTSNQIILAGGVSGGVYKSIDNGATWVRKSPTGQHFSCTSIAQDPRVGFQDTWYYGVGEPTGNSAGATGAFYSGNGVYKSTDNGETWTRQANSNTTALESFSTNADFVLKVVVDPTNGNVYAACAAAILRSTDGGGTWNPVLSGALSSSNNFTDIVVTSTGRFYAAFAGSNAVGADGVWASNTGASASWTRIAGPGGTPVGWNANAAYGRVVLGIAPSSENLVYALYSNNFSSDCSVVAGLEAELFRWNNTTSAWTDLSATLPDEAGCLNGNDPFAVQGGYDLVVAVKPDDPTTVFIGGTNVYRSTTSGTSWTRIGGYNSPASYSLYLNSHPDIHAIVFQPGSPAIMLCGNDGGIQRSTNDLAATVVWTPINNGYRTYQYYYVVNDPRNLNAKVIGGAQDNGSTRNTGGTGINFESVFGGDGVSVGLSGASDLEYVGSQNGNISRRSAASGANVGTSITPTFANTVTSAGLFVTLFKLDPDNTERLYYVNDDTLYLTTTASTVTSGTWSKMTGVATAVGLANDITALAMTRGTYSAATTSLFMGTSNGKVYRLDNPTGVAVGTAPVNITGTINAGYISSIAVNPRNDDTVLVTLSNYGITNAYWTGNANAASPTWTAVEGTLTLPSYRSAAIAINGTTNAVEYYVGTSAGLYASAGLPGSVAWAQEGSTTIGNAVVSCLDLRPSDNKLLVGTHGYGMWSASIPITSCSITLTSAAGTNAQTKCINNAITNITYSTTSATGATFSGLPTGVTGSWASNVVTISGSPSVAGTFNYTVTLTGGSCIGVTATGSITVTPDNTISRSSAVGTDAQTVCINTAITNITYATTGATGATFLSLPAGVTGSWAANVATITGTPSVAGTFNYLVSTSGGCNTTSLPGTITVTANNTVNLSSAAGTNAQTKCINTAITNITYSTTGATGATVTGLPTGVTGGWAANVVTITGTPSVAGTFNYTVTLTGGCGNITATGSITVTANNTINLTSAAGTNAQTKCFNTPITNITYSTTGATGATVTGLPTGVTGGWAANVVTISGSPTQAGTFNYTVTLTGGCGTVTANGSITVTANNTISLSSAPGSDGQTKCINTAITNITYPTTGATGATITGLPAGVTGGWAANVVTISGTPNVVGTFNYTVSLTGGCGTVGAGGFIIVPANNTINLTSAAGTNAQTLCINSAMTNITYSTTGATGATVTGLPAGVTGGWSANVVTISGIPSVAGTFNYTVTLTGGCGTVIANGSITVTAIRTITLSSAAGTNAQSVCINTAITNITYTTTGVAGATVTGLPAGVTGSWAANVVTITGTPSVAGTFNYTVTPTGGCGTATATGSITVVLTNSINLISGAGTNVQTRCINAAITTILYSTTGATGATITGLPPGVTGGWASNVVTISGAPTVAGTFDYTVTLTGGCGAPTATGTITVPPNNTINLTSAAGTNAQTKCINTAITDITYATTGATGANFSGLPAGVSGLWLPNVATISGTPTVAGTFNYTITLTGGCGNITATGSIIVTANNTINLSSAAGTDAQTKCINNAITNITYSTTGATGATVTGLPAGVAGGWSANVVTIVGTPSVAGTFNYTVSLTGGCGTVTALGSITVSPNNTATLTSAAGTNAQTKCINTAITNITYSTTGATGATVTGLPTGVTGVWAANVETISGTPSVAGTFNYTVTLTGGCGTITANGSITVTVNNTINLTSGPGSNVQTKCINTAINNVTYSTTGATGATVTGLPTGVTGVWAANVITISGTPSVAGTFNYTVTLTGGCGTVTATGSITVNPLPVVSITGPNPICAACPGGPGSTIYTATLSGPAESPSNASPGTGIATITINTLLNTMRVQCTFSGLTGTTTASHIHAATAVANTGTAGVATTTPNFTGFPLGVTSGTYDNTFDMTLAGSYNPSYISANGGTTASAFAALIAALDANKAYYNIHSSTFGGGEIRGFLTTSCTGTNSSTTLSPSSGGTWVSNNPAVATVTNAGVVNAVSAGTATFTFTNTTTTCSATSSTVTVNPNNTVTLTSAAGTNAQTKCINTAITNISYSTTGATGATFSGLPAGVTGIWAANVITISGTPSASGTFNYTVTLTGGCGTVTATGSITVIPNNTVNLTSAAGTNAQTVVVNTAITNITYSTTGATGATFTGLPAGVTGSWVANVVTISGTPTATGTFNYTVTLTGGCGNITATGSITVTAAGGITINLKLFLQGYYVGSSTMQPVLNNQSVPSSLATQTDTVMIDIFHPTTFALLATKKAVLSTTGNVSATFTQSPGSYYIGVRHRNTIQTWTKSPVACSASTPLYNFTTAANKAYDDNQVQVEPGVWAFFAGDLNQDEYIDGNDFPQYDAESASGGVYDGTYTITDMNGDGFVDGNDFPVFDVNSSNGVSSLHP
ncbi:MAG: CHRD domain-containing protein [Ferruginibacter sp.]